MIKGKDVILTARDIVVEFDVRDKVLTAIRGVSLDLIEGEVLALVGEVLRAFAEIGVEDALQAHFPLGGEFLALVFGYGGHIRLQQGEELVEVIERVAVQAAGEGHGVLRADAVVLDAVEGVVDRSALCELAVAVQPHHLNGTVHVGLVGHEALAEVIGLARCLQDLGLKEAQRGVVPAGARAVLVLDAGNLVFLDGGEDRLVLVFFLLFLLALCACAHGRQDRQRQQ